MTHYFSRARFASPVTDLDLMRMVSRHGAAYRDHALVWRLFPGDGAERDFVFRRGTDQDGRDVYYVVSQRPPQSVPGLLTVQSKPYAPALEEGEMLRFELRANPTVTRRNADGTRGQRHDVLMNAKAKALAQGASVQKRIEEMDAAGLRWLQERAATWGISVAENSVLVSAYTQHTLRHRQRNMTFSSLDYTGVAQVENPVLLAKALTQGVGHAKAFGCGLLLVRRID
ncbi:CRISPR-associated protein, Cse3 family [plant metagenome]